MEKTEEYGAKHKKSRNKHPLLKNADDTINKLEAEMKKAAKDLDFEKAAILRDRIKNIREQLGE